MNAIIAGTPRWSAEKIGTLSATRAVDIMGSEAVRRTLLDEMIVEIVTAKPPSFNPTKDMLKGIKDQKEAILAYKTFNTKVKAARIVEDGYCESDFSPFVVCSPDGFVDVLGAPSGGVETKNLKPTNHFRIVDTNGAALDKDHKSAVYQCKWTIMVTGRAWWDLFYYCKELPPSMRYYLRRFERDESEVKDMKEAGKTFIDLLIATLKKYGVAL